MEIVTLCKRIAIGNSGHLTSTGIVLYSKRLNFSLNKRALHNKGKKKRKCEYNQSSQTDTHSAVSHDIWLVLSKDIMKIEERSSLLPTKPDPTGSQIGVN
jgi:hypothetical protein